MDSKQRASVRGCRPVKANGTTDEEVMQELKERSDLERENK